MVCAAPSSRRCRSSFSSWSPGASSSMSCVLLLIAFAGLSPWAAADEHSTTQWRTEERSLGSQPPLESYFEDSQFSDSSFLHRRHRRASDSEFDDPDDFPLLDKESGGNLQASEPWTTPGKTDAFLYSSAFRYKRLRVSTLTRGRGRLAQIARFVFLATAVLAAATQWRLARGAQWRRFVAKLPKLEEPLGEELAKFRSRALLHAPLTAQVEHLHPNISEQLASATDQKTPASEKATVTAEPTTSDSETRKRETDNAREHAVAESSVSHSSRVRQLILEGFHVSSARQNALFKPKGLFQDADAPLLYIFFPASRGSLKNVIELQPTSVHVAQTAQQMALALQELRASGVKAPVSLDLSNFEVDDAGRVRLHVLAAVAAAEKEQAKEPWQRVFSSVSRFWNAGKLSGTAEPAGRLESGQTEDSHIEKKVGEGEKRAREGEKRVGEAETNGGDADAKSGVGEQEAKDGEVETSKPAGLFPKCASRMEQRDVLALGNAFADLAALIRGSREKNATPRGLMGAISLRMLWKVLDKVFPKSWWAKLRSISAGEHRQQREAERLEALAEKILGADSPPSLDAILADELFTRVAVDESGVSSSRSDIEASSPSPQNGEERSSPAVRVDLLPGSSQHAYEKNSQP
ncbi:hypothetical protein TGRUB_294410 [Toxoplasma gondii RUB]|uniref:Transmembrane protein n=3 Tax=Toxoplasma gondii TaxID=5811 RepID=A0A086LSA9_TOXGO|nr:hypothetical protein TGRUB_294410 [Toxoplasma gondii RUB]